jgi:diaminopimelate epimerase
MRASPRAPSRPISRAALADRHRGVGFDQLAVIEPDAAADLSLTFFNADGSPSAACGNATRCIARYEMDGTGPRRPDAQDRTRHPAGARRGNGLTSVNMGQPRPTGPTSPWPRNRHAAPAHRRRSGRHRPWATRIAPSSLPMPRPSTSNARAGDRKPPALPRPHQCPGRQPDRPDHLRMRVWERGTGITLASGSSSCAVAVAAARRGLTGRTVRLTLDGGTSPSTGAKPVSG